MKLILLGLSLVNLIKHAKVDDDSEKKSKSLHYKQSPDELNIDNIISLWNRSVADDGTKRKFSSQLQSPSPLLPPQSKPTTDSVRPIQDKSRLREKQGNLARDNFVDRFNSCVNKHRTVSAHSSLKQQHQSHMSIVMVCLKAEIMTKLHFMLASPPNESITLFNGYIKLEKLNNTQPASKDKETKIRKYSAKMPTTDPSPQKEEENPTLVPVLLKHSNTTQSGHNVGSSNSNDYYESYQKMLKELVARKSADFTSVRPRSKRDEDSTLSNIIQKKRKTTRTLEKSARLFESGRKLFAEITTNLENEEEHVKHLKEAVIRDAALAAAFDNFTKSFSLRFNFYPGISARMTRNANSGVTFDLELDDDDSTTENVNSDKDGDEDDGGSGSTNGGRQKKKPKKKKGPKISKKTLKKLFPYLLIPFIIQAALLPIVLKFLLFIAIKALIAGKLALILVAFNAIRNASLKSDEDEYIERMSYAHYGYGSGEEYGAWVNRRTFSPKPGVRDKNKSDQDIYYSEINDKTKELMNEEDDEEEESNDYHQHRNHYIGDHHENVETHPYRSYLQKE